MSMMRSLLLLIVCCILESRVSGQYTEDYYYGGDFSPEYRAATVVTNLWIGLFAVCSTVFGLLGMVVATQWPNPRICCYKTPFSDLPSRAARTCCSLYGLNVGFAIFWTLVFAIMCVAKDIPRLVACLCFSLMHVLVIVSFRLKFSRHGRPHYVQESDVGAVTSSSSSSRPGARPAMGIPLYNIPMSTVMVGRPPPPHTAAAADGSSYPSGYHMPPMGPDGSCQYPPPYGGSSTMPPPGSYYGSHPGHPHLGYAPYSGYSYMPYTVGPDGVLAYPPMYQYHPNSRPGSCPPGEAEAAAAAGAAGAVETAAQGRIGSPGLAREEVAGQGSSTSVQGAAAAAAGEAVQYTAGDSRAQVMVVEAAAGPSLSPRAGVTPATANKE